MVSTEGLGLITHTFIYDKTYLQTYQNEQRCSALMDDIGMSGNKSKNKLNESIKCVYTNKF